VTLAFRGPYPNEVLSKVADDTLKPALQQISGVGTVDLLGFRTREITIVVDPVRLRAFGLAASDLVASVGAQHIDVPGGRTAEANLERTVKLKAEAESVDDLRDLIVASPMGSPIHLRDVADVIDGPAEARSLATLSGQSAIGLIVRKQSGGNTVKVADAVKDSLESISKQLPPGSKVEIVTDGSNFIRASIDGVKEDLLLGGILAVVVVMVFLRNWRSTLVTAIALPVSIIGTFAIMHALNFTFNIVSRCYRKYRSAYRDGQARTGGCDLWNQGDCVSGYGRYAGGCRGVHSCCVYGRDCWAILLSIRRDGCSGCSDFLCGFDVVDSHIGSEASKTSHKTRGDFKSD
jgi:HAE1 family hydrophobic/amphiphilic exporter-1